MAKGLTSKSCRHGGIPTRTRESNNSTARQWTRQEVARTEPEPYSQKKLSKEDVQSYKYWLIDRALEDNFE